MRVVALRALGLGDLLTAVPALRGLRAAFPDAELLLAGPPVLAPLAALAGAQVVAAEPLGPLPPRARGADLLVNLHGRGPQSTRRALEARPRRLLAFAHPGVPETAGGPTWREAEHEVVRWCRMLRAGGIRADPRALSLPVPVLDPALEAWRGATVVHPGAASRARRWPVDRFAAVAAAERAAGRTVVVTGGPDERGLAVAVARSAGLDDDAVLAGRTDLAALAALVAHAGRVVCGDTGVAHLATAFATPSVVLFGPTDPARWGPPASARHRVLWTGRTGDPHADVPDPGLLALDVHAVHEALAALPARSVGLALAWP